MTPQDEAHPSSSMEEVAAKRPEEVRAPAAKNKPHEAPPETARAHPLSHASHDGSPIEGERGKWLKRRAKSMRAEMTPHESAMWALLGRGELVALNWRRQAVLGDYVLDFVSHPARLVIEVDGAQHAQAAQAEHDAARTRWLEGQGYSVLRFWNVDVMQAQDGVWDVIHQAAAQTPARSRMERWRLRNWASSSSMEEVAAKRPEEVRAQVVKKEPREARLETSRAHPLSHAPRDSSPIEGER